MAFASLSICISGISHIAYIINNNELLLNPYKKILSNHYECNVSKKCRLPNCLFNALKNIH